MVDFASFDEFTITINSPRIDETWLTSNKGRQTQLAQIVDSHIYYLFCVSKTVQPNTFFVVKTLAKKKQKKQRKNKRKVNTQKR